MLDKIRIMTKPRIYTMIFANIYPLYIAKAEKKGRTKAEVNEIIRWLTGYSQEALEAQLEKQTEFETFFAQAPQLNPSQALIKGVVCGVRVEDIEDPHESYHSDLRLAPQRRNQLLCTHQRSTRRARSVFHRLGSRPGSREKKILPECLT